MFRPLHWAIIRSQCVSEETILCSIYIAISSNEISLITRPLYIVNTNKYYKIKIITCTKNMYPMGKLGWCELNGVGGWYEWKGCGVFIFRSGMGLVSFLGIIDRKQPSGCGN
jgi:hypothetical protein